MLKNLAAGDGVVVVSSICSNPSETKTTRAKISAARSSYQPSSNLTACLVWAASLLNLSRAVLVSEMQDKGDKLRKTAIQEKGEAESAGAEFKGFHSFTEGLLAQGTPLEIAGTHRMVSVTNLIAFL